MELFDFPDSNNLKETVNISQKHQINNNLIGYFYQKQILFRNSESSLSLTKI